MALTVLVSGCVEELPVDMPTPPDLGALLRDWEGPTAEFTDHTAMDVAISSAKKLGMAEDLGTCDASGQCSGPAVLIGALGALGGSGTETSELAPGVEQRRDALQIGDTAVEAEGFARIRMKCAGWDGGSPDENAMVITVTFSDAGLQPVVWGQFSDCRITSGGSDLYLDAGVHLHLGESFDLAKMGQTPLLFQLQGDLGVGERDLIDLDLDFEVSPEDGLEIRVPVADLHLFLFMKDGKLGFSAVNGRWLCQFGAGDHSTGLCGTRDGEEVAW